MSKSILSDLRRLARIESVETLRNVGNVCRARTIPSKRDKANDPKRQRKTRSWERGDD